MDLSIGTPVDPVPPLIQAALAAGADWPGYPATYGTTALREAAAGWLARCHGVQVSPDAVLPLIGTKEFIAWLPTVLGCGAGDVVLHPRLAYPTYDVGARLAGARPVRADPADLAAGPAGGVTEADADAVRLAWLNSPSNPTGAVLPAAQLRQAADWARQRGAVVASDECYLELGWDAEPVSVLAPEACGGSHQGLLAVHSLSKRSNLAGYRAGLRDGRSRADRHAAGDPQARGHDRARAGAGGHDGSAVRRRARTRAAGPVRGPARPAAARPGGGGLAGHALGSRACTCGPSTRTTTAGAASRCWPRHGILVAPGDFYGPAGARHIRVALTATDERIDAAASRLAALA